MTDPEVERIAEMCWRAFARSPHGDWIEGASAPEVYAGALATDWRAVARAVLADRADQRDHRGVTHWEGCWDAGPRHYECLRRRVASQPPVTDGPTLVEAARERDALRGLLTDAETERDMAQARNADLEAGNDAVLTGLRHERDALRARLAEVERDRWGEHDAAERHFRQRDEAIRERDEARAECEAAEAQADGERQRRKSAEATRDAAIAERDALQRRLDAITSWAPSDDVLNQMREAIPGDKSIMRVHWRAAAIVVRDALLTAQAPPEPTLSQADILKGSEEILRRIAASAALGLDPEEAAAIVAELDRLRAENDALRAQLHDQAREADELITQGREAERAAVVAWLHQIGAAPADVTSHSLHDAADSIVRGDHLAEKEKP